MRESVGRKINSEAGMSLSEMLVTLLIMLLAFELMSQTIQIAVRQFDDRTRESEAQLLCSSLATAIKEELTYAKEVEAVEDRVSFFDERRKMGASCSLVTLDGIKTKGGSVAEVDMNGAKIAEYGEVYIVNDRFITDGTIKDSNYSNLYPLVPHADYNHSGTSNSENDFKAKLDITWDDARFHVVLTVVDSDEEIEYSKADFYVRSVYYEGQ